MPGLAYGVPTVTMYPCVVSDGHRVWPVWASTTRTSASIRPSTMSVARVGSTVYTDTSTYSTWLAPTARPTSATVCGWVVGWFRGRVVGWVVGRVVAVV